jgi:hypothetical protein
MWHDVLFPLLVVSLFFGAFIYGLYRLLNHAKQASTQFFDSVWARQMEHIEEVFGEHIDRTMAGENQAPVVISRTIRGDTLLGMYPDLVEPLTHALVYEDSEAHAAGGLGAPEEEHVHYDETNLLCKRLRQGVVDVTLTFRGE